MKLKSVALATFLLTGTLVGEGLFSENTVQAEQAVTKEVVDYQFVKGTYYDGINYYPNARASVEFKTKTKSPGTMIIEYTRNQLPLDQWEDTRRAEVITMMLYKEGFGFDGRDQFAPRYMSFRNDGLNRDSKENFKMRFTTYIDVPTSNNSYYLMGISGHGMEKYYNYTATFYPNQNLMDMNKDELTKFLETGKRPTVEDIKIPNVQLPANHGQAVAGINIRQTVNLLKLNADGSFTVEKPLYKGTVYRVYGVKGNKYSVGGGYYVEHQQGVAIHVGHALLGADNVMYAPDGKVHKTLPKGTSVKVYSYDDTKYQVGGGYYIKKSPTTKFVLGIIQIKAPTTLYNLDGTVARELKFGEGFHTDKLDEDKVFISGRYYVKLQKGVTKYIKL
ncbi:hypothetical protein [Jeotgalibacillus sp. R-1-5s-1]|uniref:hypothetical protein n=1 Tax=Jeotgalibacillus sp. R-1-5s-1 TaxID=2555897 RepID=UPI001069E489|nr:hypothetical protein [Jeotgalibacillus sp. R-1-5s-1]TFD97080.1 hypothetical protein E2491_10340 [Jeotgalibacillus sp. R-1-5s-1]